MYGMPETTKDVGDLKRVVAETLLQAFNAGREYVTKHFIQGVAGSTMGRIRVDDRHLTSCLESMLADGLVETGKFNGTKGTKKYGLTGEGLEFARTNPYNSTETARHVRGLL
jgi:hypothetical protein